MFFDNKAAVVISTRWQATDFPLTNLTLAEIAVLDKNGERGSFAGWLIESEGLKQN